MGPLIWAAACADRPAVVPVAAAPVGDVSLAWGEVLLEGNPRGSDLGEDLLAAGDLDGDGGPEVVASDGPYGLDLAFASDRLRTTVGVGVTDAAVLPAFGERGPVLVLTPHATSQSGYGVDGGVVAMLTVAHRRFDEVAYLAHAAAVPFEASTWYRVEPLGHGALAVRRSLLRPADVSLTWILREPAGALELDDDADARLSGPPVRDDFGLASGDLDGDGVTELVTPLDAEGLDVVLIPADLAGDATLPGGFRTLAGVGSRALAAGGDLDGDGRDDVVTAGVEDAWVFVGPVADATGPADAVARLRPWATPGERVEDVAIARDLDGDGIDDLLAGVPDDARTGSAGVVAVWYGPVAGERELHEADARLLGESQDDRAGRWVLGPGDVDGDGFGDVVVAAPGHEDRGAVYLLPSGPR